MPDAALELTHHRKWDACLRRYEALSLEAKLMHPSMPTLLVPIDVERGPRLPGGHHFEAVDVDVVRQGRDVEDLFRDVLGGQRSGAAVELVGSVLVALGADQGEFGFGHAGGNVGDPNASAQQVAAQVVAELLDECLGGAVDVAARIRPVAGNRADADDARALRAALL